MRLLVVAGNDSDIRKNIENICNSLNIDYEFSDKVEDWSGFEALLMGFGGLRKLSSYVHKMKDLKMIQTLSAGVDMINYDVLPKGVILCSNAGAFSRPVAEHAISLILGLSKRLVLNYEEMKEGKFDQRAQNKTVENSTLGIIGYGGIGREVAKLGRGLGMKVIAVSRRKTRWDKEVIGNLGHLNNLLRRSDVVVVSIPLNKFTRGLIDKTNLKKMKKSAMIINVARAEIIVQEDLYNHLKTNPEFMAGLDVWWKEPMSHGKFELDFPFLELKNVLASPHNSGIVQGQEYYAFLKALENVKKWMIRVEPDNLVKVEDYV